MVHYSCCNGSARAVAGTPENAESYGIDQYLLYDIYGNVPTGLRVEWFREQNGLRVFGPGRRLIKNSFLDKSLYDICL